VVSRYQQIANFSMVRVSNGASLHRETFMGTSVMPGSAVLNKQSYISLLLQDTRSGARLCLMAADELSRKCHYSLSLRP
jgi:hypothetical protein